MSTISVPNRVRPSKRNANLNARHQQIGGDLKLGRSEVILQHDTARVGVVNLWIKGRLPGAHNG